MTTKPPGLIAQAWHRWKALRLPWRRHFLAGVDLNGNTYWEFRIAGTAATERLRRIVKYPRSTHYSDVRISPQWHQWLRYTRQDPPSVAEQRQDLVRQARMKQLAAAADARWEAKPRLTDAPGAATGQPVPSLEGAGMAGPGQSKSDGKSAAAQGSPTESHSKQADQDPWGQAKARGPSEKWQPEAWAPTPSKK